MELNVPGFQDLRIVEHVLHQLVQAGIVVFLHQSGHGFQAGEHVFADPDVFIRGIGHHLQEHGAGGFHVAVCADFHAHTDSRGGLFGHREVIREVLPDFPGLQFNGACPVFRHVQVLGHGHGAVFAHDCADIQLAGAFVYILHMRIGDKAADIAIGVGIHDDRADGAVAVDGNRQHLLVAFEHAAHNGCDGQHTPQCRAGSGMEIEAVPGFLDHIRGPVDINSHPSIQDKGFYELIFHDRTSRFACINHSLLLRSCFLFSNGTMIQ